MRYTANLKVNGDIYPVEIAPDRSLLSVLRTEIGLTGSKEGCDDSECGACMVNCPTGAIEVESGVGCASAMMLAALKGKKEASCGCDDGPTCCS